MRSSASAWVLALIVVLASSCGGSSAEREAETTTAERREAAPPPTPSGPSHMAGLSGTEVEIRGALEGTVRDAAGNVLGTVATGIQRVDAPHGSFDTTGEGGQYFLRTAGPHSGSWTALRDGEARFIVRNYADDRAEATAATFPIALRKGAKVTLRLSAPAQLRSLEVVVDENGDARTDRRVPFGAAAVGAGASDRLQPVSRVAVEHVTDGSGKTVARITITAADRGGAGIARIQYALAASGRTGIYRGPFEAPAVGRIVVRAIDRAGNIEAPYPRVSLAP